MYHRRRIQPAQPALSLDELRAEAQRLYVEVEQMYNTLKANFEATPRVYTDIRTLRAYRALLVKCKKVERDLATAEKKVAAAGESHHHRMLLIMDE